MGNIGRCCTSWQGGRLAGIRPDFKTEFLGKPANDFVVQLSPVSLLEHGYRRLIAPKLGGKFALRNLRSAPSLFCLKAEIWTKVLHGRILWTLFYQLARGHLSTLSTELSTYEHMFTTLFINAIDNINTCGRVFQTGAGIPGRSCKVCRNAEALLSQDLTVCCRCP